VVELRIAAQADMVFTARTVASQVAHQADFDPDAASDFRMAVDEVCNTLIPLTSTGSILTCTFITLTGRIHIAATVPPDPADAVVDTQSWGWRVLQALLDKVTVRSLETGEGVRQLQVRATKSVPSLTRPLTSAARDPIADPAAARSAIPAGGWPDSVQLRRTGYDLRASE
jgi:serine/threonine-protein kinase RsbW